MMQTRVNSEQGGSQMDIAIAKTAHQFPIELQDRPGTSTVGVAQPLSTADSEKARYLALRDGMTGWQWLLFHVVIFFSAAISGYDVGNVATIQVNIYEAFGHIDLLPWIATAYSLGNAATSPLLNRIMKLVDLKWFMLSCWVVFAVSSVAAGASPTIQGIIVGRLLLGISGGGIYLGLLTYINILARPTEHPRATSLLGMGFATGLVFGPIIGSAFATNEHATWRWAFYVCVPYIAVIMALIVLVCPNVRVQAQEKVTTMLIRIDWIGGLLHMTTLVLFISACIFSGSTLAWNSGVIALWVLSTLSAVVYAIQQTHSSLRSADPILPIAVMSTRIGALVLLCTFMASAGYGVALYYLPLFYAFTRGDDAILTAVHMLPYICVYIAGAIGAGVLLPRIRRYALIYLFGGALLTAGSAAIQVMKKDTPLSESMGLSALIGFGVGSTSQLGASVLALGLPSDIRMDSGIAMTITVYSGLTITLAIAGCIFQNIGYTFLSNALAGVPLSGDGIRSALAGVVSTSGLSPEVLDAAVGAVTLAVIRIFYVSVAAGVLMLLASIFMEWEALDFKSAAPTPPDEYIKPST